MCEIRSAAMAIPLIRVVMPFRSKLLNLAPNPCGPKIPRGFHTLGMGNSLMIEILRSTNKTSDAFNIFFRRGISFDVGMVRVLIEPGHQDV